MTAEVTRLLELWRASTFRDFSGAQLELRVPLNEAVLNQVLAAVVLPRVPQLRELGAVVYPENRIDLRVATSLARWLPALTIPLCIYPELVFTPAPVLYVDIRRGSLAAEITPLAGLWSSRLPPGVRLLDRRLEVNLAELAPPEARLFVTWIRRGEFSTAEGVLWLGLTLSIP